MALQADTVPTTNAALATDGTTQLTVDSRGEPILTKPNSLKDASGKPIPVVPPRLIHSADPGRPRSNKEVGDALIVGVVAENGDYIDAKVVGQVAPELAKRALSTVAKYKFKPATISGKPVAVVLRINFNVHDYW